MEQDFLAALSGAGIAPTSPLILDGNLRRYHVSGDKRGRKNGWYRYTVLRHGLAFAVFGSNRSGVTGSWSSKERRLFDNYEKKLYERKKREIEKSEEEGYIRAAQRANAIWARARDVPAAEALGGGHPYLLKKGVACLGLRQMYGHLVMPLSIANWPVTIQFISADGGKHFLTGGAKKGASYTIKGSPDTIYIVEGYATGASISMATGKMVAVACDAGNLVPVAAGVREAWPDAKIVVAGDHDQWTPGNPGRAKATEAADKCGGTARVPEEFSYDDPSHPTDWNDYHGRYGLAALRDALQGALTDEGRKTEIMAPGEWRGAGLIEGKEFRPGFPMFDGKSKENAYLFLEHHHLFKDMVAYNVFSSRLIMTRQPPWDAGSFCIRPLENRDYFNATRLLERCGIRTSKEVVEDSFESIGCGRLVNPPYDYLESLRWDGRDRLRGWLTYYLGAEKQNPEYLALIGAKWLMGAVSRIYAPGIKYDNVLILEGAQDTKKSMVFKTITRFYEEPYFLEFSGDVTHKDSLGMMQGRIVVELSELASLRRAQIEDMKTFITRETDTFRPAWGRAILERKRVFILGATTNNDPSDGYLVDPTGGRRYLPVSCGKIDIETLTQDKDQLWAEAVTRWKAGERTWLESVEEKELALYEQRERQHEDSWMRPISEYLVDKAETDVYRICREGLGLPVDKIGKANEDRVRACLRKLEWERTGDRPRFDYGRCTTWRRKI